MVVAAATRERVRGEIVRLVHRGLGVPELVRAVRPVLNRAVPFDGTCLLTVDPATLLPTGEVVQDGLPEAVLDRLTEIELREPDVNKFAALARVPTSTASLSAATRGVLDRSRRQRELRRPSGFADELRSVLTGVGGPWGALTLLRATGRPHFAPVEVRFVASVAAVLADGFRQASLLGTTAGDPADGEVGLLVLAADGSVELANRAADRWLDELGAGDRGAARLPLAVRSTAGQARRAAAGAGGPAWARVRTRTGRWAVVRGSLLGDGPDARVAVLLDAARAPELAPLIADAYRLTDRERLVTELVARGYSTGQIAARLHLSAYTVQDHLKAIFDKSGTGSRGELVARLFVDQLALRHRGSQGVAP